MPREGMTTREVALLTDAISVSKKRNQEHEINMEKDVVEIFSVALAFIKSNRVLCYGGTAINAALDEEDKFYDETMELPDYDFFSTRALSHAKELANIYARKGYVVNAKAGQHHGTYKVFVNFLPVADITQCDPRIFGKLWQQRLIKKGVGYVPPHFLKWSMYTELSRPMGDVGRWEKVYTRLKLLEKKYPLTKCVDPNGKSTRRGVAELYRPFESHQYKAEDVHVDLKRAFAEEGAIFFGFGAFAEYMYSYKRQKRPVAVDFEVVCVDYISCANTIKTKLTKHGYHPIYLTHFDNIDEFMPSYYEVRLGRLVVAHIYNSVACYSYNVVDDRRLGIQMRVATVETLLSFYFIFLYVDKHYNTANRVICMARALLELQRKHLHATSGLLRRFTIECHGSQKTKKDIMHEKYHKFIELKDQQKNSEYEKWFLNYKPTVRSRSSPTTKRSSTSPRSSSSTVRSRTRTNLHIKRRWRTKRMGRRGRERKKSVSARTTTRRKRSRSDRRSKSDRRSDRRSSRSKSKSKRTRRTTKSDRTKRRRFS